MTTAINEVFVGLEPENFCLVVGEISLWWGNKNLVGDSTAGK